MLTGGRRVRDMYGAGRGGLCMAERNTHLALGVFYANVGMVVEAEREFQSLVNKNPRLEIAAELLRTVRSWR